MHLESQPETPTPTGWCTQLRRGDRGALDLVTKVTEIACRRHKIPRPTYDDVRQEVLRDLLVACLRNGRDVETHVEGFVYRIASRRSIDKIRESEKTRRHLVRQPDWNALQNLLRLEPDDQIAADLVRNLVGRIPSPCKQLFHWRFGEGLKYREIGVKLGTKEGAAKMRVRDCLQKARAALQETRSASGPSAP